MASPAGTATEVEEACRWGGEEFENGAHAGEEDADVWWVGEGFVEGEIEAVFADGFEILTLCGF